jgi:hypothetical protein
MVIKIMAFVNKSTCWKSLSLLVKIKEANVSEIRLLNTISPESFELARPLEVPYSEVFYLFFFFFLKSSFPMGVLGSNCD